MTADDHGHVWTALEDRPSTHTAMDAPGRLAYSYGSEVRARCVRPIGGSDGDAHGRSRAIHHGDELCAHRSRKV